MEKKRSRKKDMLRMDGLLPPTRRLPVCDAVTGTSDKKKDKKWSIGGIIRRISSMRDYESSSNDEEIVYCKKTSRKSTKFGEQSDGIVLNSITNNSERNKRTSVENNVRRLTNSPSLRRDSLHSRGSDGSLDGLGKKVRRNKVKARAEAKRDHLRVDSSSDDDCQKSNNSLNRFHNVDVVQNGQRNNMFNRKTRAARTERYIKRLSKDEGNNDIFNEGHKISCSVDHIDDQQDVAYVYTNGLCRPPIHPRRFIAHSNNCVSPVQKSSAGSLQNMEYMTLPEQEIKSFGDLRRYSTGQYITAFDSNNAQSRRIINRDTYVDSCKAGNFFTYPAKNVSHYSESTNYAATDCRSNNSDNQPPEPPPRDPRYRVFGFGYNSYPLNKTEKMPHLSKQEYDRTSVANRVSKPDCQNLRVYGSNNEITCYGTTQYEQEYPISVDSKPMKFYNSLECINNKYNSNYHTNKPTYKETSMMNCRPKTTYNDQFNFNDISYDAHKVKSKSPNVELRKYETIPRLASSDWLSSTSPSSKHILRTITSNDTCNTDIFTKKSEKEETDERIRIEEEKRRSSKNLEEALSELEAIYTSLRLGDEDLLDRAERRSMEEFNLKQNKNEIMTSVETLGSADRTKDDMAYRRMHPKEKPASDIMGQSALSNISYLIASPVLSRKDSVDDFSRLSPCYSSYRDEPDITRDDVVFRSINHANNTLKISDPQPPFGIPLGPVTAATESDYLHTTPTKPNHPRSSYIPQSEPDVVTDDLAYRTLRKDAGTSRNIAESKNNISQDSPISCTKKKRAVRSSSANLYGLINHDRIHLHREPNIESIKHENQDMRKRNSVTTSEKADHLRCVVSDGELSDNDAYRRKKASADIDINGNHPTVYRKEQCDYISLEETIRQSPKQEKRLIVTELSDAMLPSKSVLDNKSWHEYSCSDSNASTHSGRNTEADFAVYTRLCQDLLNLIKDNDDDVSSSQSPNTEDVITPVTSAMSSDKLDDFDINSEMNESLNVVHVRPEDNHYPESQRALRINSKYIENENAPNPIVSSINSVESLEAEQAKNFDFYMRVADENVKLIAEAFGSVADHIRDSRLLARKNSSTSYGSENENHSTRSSTLYSPDDANDGKIVSSKLEKIRTSSKRNSLTNDERDQDKEIKGTNHLNDTSTNNVERDLSIVVRDLQLAAASLYEHKEEINELELECKNDVVPTAVASDDKTEKESILKNNLVVDTQEQERDQEETLVLPSGIELPSRNNTAEDNQEGEHTVCELKHKLFTAEDTQSDRVCISYVTNLITISVTTYSMILLACLLALLLAILAAL